MVADMIAAFAHRIAAALAGLAVLAAPALAQNLDADPCNGLVSSRELPIARVALQPGEVGVTFIGHSTFLIESPGGVRIATDYNDYVRPSGVPDVVTMNRAHSTHFTDRPDPRIPHVLRGWDPSGAAARISVAVGDVIIRNVPTSIRDWGGGTERDANSIFVFETAGLCVAHLGHLHHTLLPGHLKMLGRIDVVLVPVDGSFTLDQDGMFEVLAQINAPLMIPMHYFGSATLNRFLARAKERYEVASSPTNSITVSRETLPATPKVLVLPER